MKMFEALLRGTTALSERLARLDAWANDVTGFGTSRDKTMYGQAIASAPLAPDYLAALYNDNDTAARIVDAVPDEVYREGFQVLTEIPELDEIIADKLEQLCVYDRFADGMRWGRAFGAGAVLIGADDGQEASRPLNAKRANDIHYLFDFDRRSLYPLTYYGEFGHPKFGQPETYLVFNESQQANSQIIVHETRLILFGGATTAKRERIANEGWDLSVLQRPHDVLRSFDVGWKSVEVLLTDAHQTVMKMSGLAEIIGAPGGMEAMQKRARLTDMYRSVLRAIVVDADANESVDRASVSFDSIPQTLDKIMLRMSAAAQIPVTILMGQAPAGMDATGESDMRWFYARMATEQKRRQSPRIRRLVQVWLETKEGSAASKGKSLDTLTVKWPSLWSESPSAEATRKKTLAEADAALVNAQVFTPDEVALTRGRVDGWSKDIILSDASIAARETALTADLEQIGAGSSAAGGEKPLPLTPTDVATITKVNEARRAVGLPPLPESEGNLTLPEFKAKYAAQIAEASLAESGQTQAPATPSAPAEDPEGGRT